MSRAQGRSDQRRVHVERSNLHVRVRGRALVDLPADARVYFGGALQRVRVIRRDERRDEHGQS
jgi:hypothetical protein